LFVLFLIVWIILNGVQAFFTHLDPDEAYYWIYSRDLAFGYFDHPPMVAGLINLGYKLFQNELGVRIGTILLQAGTFYGTYLLVGRPAERRKVWLLIVLLAAVPLLNVYGFIMTPDGPLLLLAVLFLLLFRHFLPEEGNTPKPQWWVVIALGAIMAALLYSKYHGIVWIGLCTLAMLSTLLKNSRYYVAAIIGVILFLPHLYWQYEHGFPSFRYHLSGRDDPYELKHTVTYLLNQVVIFSPFLFPLLLKALFKPAVNNRMTRVYQWLIYGFWVFFFLMSFKGHVEPQWTVLISIPLLVLAYQQGIRQSVFYKWLMRMGIISIVILIPVRVLLVWNYAGIKSEFHQTGWADQLQKEAGELPVVFSNSYRDPSVYAFYTGERTYTFTDVYYRPNQWDIWSWESDLHGKDALLVGKERWDCPECTPFRTPGLKGQLKVMENLQVSQKVDMTYVLEETDWAGGDSISLSIQLYNPYPHDIYPDRGNMPLTFSGLFFRAGQVLHLEPLAASTSVWPAKDTISFLGSVVLPIDLQPPFDFSIGIKTGNLPPARNSFQWTQVR